MTKNKVKLIMVVLMLMVVCLYFVSGTYARYASEITGNAAVTVAKWDVDFSDGTNALENDFDLTFTVNENANVVSGKIAPSTTATATIEVDLTGTEVAVDYVASITEDALETLFDDSADSVTVTTTAKVNGVEDTSGTVNLVGDKAFEADNGKVEITITLTWANDDANNVSDTTVGAAGGTLTLPVTVSLTQHI